MATLMLTKSAIVFGPSCFFVPHAGFTNRGNEMSKKYEIPEAISRERMHDEEYVACYEASWKHQKQLKKAEDEISTARDFCETLRGHLIEEEAHTEVSVVEHIEKLISKARDRLDRHGRGHTNLFIAYFDLKEGGET